MSDDINPRYPLFAVRLPQNPGYEHVRMGTFPHVYECPVRMQLAHVEARADGIFRITLGRVNIFEDSKLGVIHTDMHDDYKLGLTVVQGEMEQEQTDHWLVVGATFIEEGTRQFFDEEDVPYSVWDLRCEKVTSPSLIGKITTQYGTWSDGYRTKLAGVLVWTSKD